VQAPWLVAGLAAELATGLRGGQVTGVGRTAWPKKSPFISNGLHPRKPAALYLCFALITASATLLGVSA
jgi:hypothetical protein